MGKGGAAGVTIIAEPPARFLQQLQKKKGKDIWLMGGGELTREFLREDLIDELYLGVVPVLIGAGIPAFPGAYPQKQFTLIENKSYSEGLLALRYERSAAKKASAKRIQ